MLISEQFSKLTVARMEMALEAACRPLPDAFASHASRTRVAQRIIECATNNTRTLTGMTRAGQQAVAELAACMIGGVTLGDADGPRGTTPSPLAAGG